MLVVTVLFCAFVLVFIQLAKGGSELFIRKIPGLEAVDDAVGRATEMGRPVLYVPGIETVSEVGTLAALTILGHVAKRVAEHGTPLEVPVADPIVMATAQEIVKNAYAEVGQSDRYDRVEASRTSPTTSSATRLASTASWCASARRPSSCSARSTRSR